MGRSPLRSIEFRGQAVEIRYAAGLSDTAGNEAHAATFIRARCIVLDLALKRDADEHDRILMHELLHFAWVRLSNARRMSWECLLASEWRTGMRGEAGWSAEWRKEVLDEPHVAGRTRHWREYVCEAFCDTGAVMCTGPSAETTLPRSALRQRGLWFERNLRGMAHI